MRFAHIVNPFRPAPGSKMAFAQQVTFKTLAAAAAFTGGDPEVELFTAQYPEDAGFLPVGFTRTPDLDRSVLDLADFPQPRRLPLLADILDRLFEQSRADYFVYSNVDIAVMPFFYSALAHFVRDGLQAFVINRRTISEAYTSLDEIPVMYSETGLQHEGFDCFVFRRDDYPGYSLGNISVGAVGVGRLLLWNLMLHADAFHLFETNHLTFHLGNDAGWEDRSHGPFNDHNIQEVRSFYFARNRGRRPDDPRNPLYPYAADLALFGIQPPLVARLRQWRARILARILGRLQAGGL